MSNELYGTLSTTATLQGTINTQTNLNGTISANEALGGNLQEQKSVNGFLTNAIIHGLSAYQIALKQGFQGSEQDWINSIKGDQVVLKRQNYKLYWKYAEQKNWKMLIDLTDLSNYSNLTNHPKINGQVLDGDIEVSIPEYNVLNNQDIDTLLR